MEMSILGTPAFPPSAPQTGPLRAELEAPIRGRSGQNLQLTVKLRNTGARALSLEWGQDALDVILTDSRGQPVDWARSPQLFYVGYSGACPPFEPCQGDLTFSLPLHRSKLRWPLPPGEYRLTVRLQKVGIEETGEILSVTFPERPLTVLP